MNLKLKHVRKTFGNQTVLTDCTAEFLEGQSTCIMGESGSGKTTLLHLVAGLLPFDSGTITYMDGSKKPTFPIAMVFQENRLCKEFDAVANVRLALPHLTPHQIKHEFERVSLSNYEKKPVGDLSGGMQRRVAIVRAMLAAGPGRFPLVLLDEPLKGMDHALYLEVRDYVKASLAGKTALIVTHDLEEANFFAKETIRI